MLFGFFGRVRFKVWLLLSSDTPAQPVMVLMCDDTTQMYRTLCFSLAVIVPTSPPQAPVPVPVGHGGGGHPPVPVPALPPPPPVQAPMHVPPIVGHNGKFKCITISMEHFITWKWINFSVPWTSVHCFCHFTDARPLCSQCTARLQMKAMGIILLLVPFDLIMTKWFEL